MVPLIGDKQALMRTFISRFARDEFLIDIVRAGLYPASFINVSNVESNSTVIYIHKFLTDLSKMVKTVQLANYTAIQNLINATQTILTIRESDTNIISYDNVFQHISTQDVSIQKLIKVAIDKKLKSTDEFRKITDSIINVIQAFNEIDSVSTTITSFGAFQNEVQSDNLSPFQSLKRYKELIIRAYNDLSQLQTLKKRESESDYFVISDNNSCEALARNLVNYISEGYSFLKTGVTLLDKYVDGLESNSLHMCAAPSNHGKSIWMCNICRGIIANNVVDFDEKDAVVFITLEDHKNKLVRRFCSIFGNFAHELLKDLFMKSYNILSSLQQDKENVKENLVQIFNYVLRDSIAKVTTGRVNLVIKHCQENTFSAGDVSRFIDRLKVEGLNTRAIFIDYVDTMAPTTQRYSSYKEYDIHGQITQELRNLALVHKIPVFTATQCNRAGEDFSIPLNNNMIGDSILLWCLV